MVSTVQQVRHRHLISASPDTSNEQEDDDSYSNISVLFELGQYAFTLCCPRVGYLGLLS